MGRTWTFGRKVAVSFAAILLLLGVSTAIAVISLRTVVAEKDGVIAGSMRELVDARRLEGDVLAKIAASRGYLLTGGDAFLSEISSERDGFQSTWQEMRRRAADAETQGLLDDVRRAEQAHQAALQGIIEARQGGAAADALADRFEREIVPRYAEFRQAVDRLVAGQEAAVETDSLAASGVASSAMAASLGVGAAALLIGFLLAFLLVSNVSRQVGTAVRHMQSSSTELQSASNQQASGAKELATSMSEISTTINELLATSRQIAESAQRVAGISEDAASSARDGTRTVDQGRESIGTIKRQVDAIVAHMLDLGRKAQQIGGVLDLINELAEQTNILSINATIEAAGAGETGKRFGVVADEIRKLSDRTALSTKEIRTLIEETRAAVNAAVLATEGGAKAVEAGARQFSEVDATFRRISQLVQTSADAGREIELSTKQQATAVQQVNAAIAGAAQSTRETEASTSQTLQTATELSHLSKDLLKFVQAPA